MINFGKLLGITQGILSKGQKGRGAMAMMRRYDPSELSTYEGLVPWEHVFEEDGNSHWERDRGAEFVKFMCMVYRSEPGDKVMPTGGTRRKTFPKALLNSMQERGRDTSSFTSKLYLMTRTNQEEFYHGLMNLSSQIYEARNQVDWVGLGYMIAYWDSDSSKQKKAWALGVASGVGKNNK